MKKSSSAADAQPLRVSRFRNLPNTDGPVKSETEKCPGCGRYLSVYTTTTEAGGTFVRLTCPNETCDKFRGG